MSQTVEIHLDKPRKIAYNFNAMCDLEEILRKPLSEAFNKAGMTEIRALLYVGFKYGDPKQKNMTIEEVGDLVSDHHFVQRKPLEPLFEQVHKAMVKAGFAESRVKEGNPPDQEDTAEAK